MVQYLYVFFSFLFDPFQSFSKIRNCGGKDDVTLFVSSFFPSLFVSLSGCVSHTRDGNGEIQCLCPHFLFLSLGYAVFLNTIKGTPQYFDPHSETRGWSQKKQLLSIAIAVAVAIATCVLFFFESAVFLFSSFPLFLYLPAVYHIGLCRVIANALSNFFFFSSNSDGWENRLRAMNPPIT